MDRSRQTGACAEIRVRIAFQAGVPAEEGVALERGAGASGYQLAAVTDDLWLSGHLVHFPLYWICLFQLM